MTFFPRCGLFVHWDNVKWKQKPGQFGHFQVDLWGQI